VIKIGHADTWSLRNLLKACTELGRVPGANRRTLWLEVRETARELVGTKYHSGKGRKEQG
jgi:hypothetical protein